MESMDRLPTDLERIKLAATTLEDSDRLRLRQYITEIIRLTNMETNIALSGDPKWRRGQIVQYMQRSRLQTGVLLVSDQHSVTVWPVNTERFKHLRMKWEDILAVKGAPLVPCEPFEESFVVSDLGEEIAVTYLDREAPKSTATKNRGKRVARKEKPKTA